MKRSIDIKISINLFLVFFPLTGRRTNLGWITERNIPSRVWKQQQTLLYTNNFCFLTPPGVYSVNQTIHWNETIIVFCWTASFTRLPPVPYLGKYIIYKGKKGPKHVGRAWGTFACFTISNKSMFANTASSVALATDTPRINITVGTIWNIWWAPGRYSPTVW